jgi:hypothetical protein
MALDISKIKASIEKIQGGGKGSGNSDLIKLSKGTHVVRIVPYEDMPFQLLYFHYGINNNNFLCPKKMHGDKCPICDFAFSVWTDYGKEKDEALKDLFKSVVAKLRIYIPIVVKSSEDKSIVFGDESNITSPKWWGVANKTYEELVEEVISSDEEGIDITDVNKGLDITIKMDNFMGRKDRFSVKSIKTAKTTSKLLDGKSASELEEIVRSVKPIGEIFTFETIQKMTEELEKYMNSSAEEQQKNEKSQGTKKDFSKPKESASDDLDSISKEIDDKFASFDDDTEE